jgi:uncharacterized Zn finger protein (UPF0148 family)
MVHFECLSKKELNPRTGTFSCPECKVEKRVYTNFEKISSNKKVKYKDKSRMLGTNMKNMLEKSKKETKDPSYWILKDVLKLENQRRDIFELNSQKINTIEIKKSNSGLDSIRVLHKYFNL